MEKIRFKEVFTQWYEYKKHYVKRSSLAAYTLLGENHLIPFFGDNLEIVEDDVQRFVMQRLSTGLSQKTIKDIVIVLKMVLKFGAKRRIFENIPFDIDYPTDHKPTNMEVLTIAETKKLIAYVKDHFSFRNIGLLLCVSTGMRIGEVCALTWEDIDVVNGVISISKTIQRIYVIEEGVRRTELLLDTPKTKNSAREIPMSQDLLKILKPIMKIVNLNYFVLTNDAKPTEPRTYRSYYKNKMEEIGLPIIKFHGLRHTFATRCINAKVDVKTVSVMLGHSNISTTLNIYVHPNTEQKKAAINMMFKSLK